VVVKDKYWDWYIAVKHVSEIIVLIHSHQDLRPLTNSSSDLAYPKGI
jgi:hypothetical protein